MDHLGKAGFHVRPCIWVSCFVLSGRVGVEDSRPDGARKKVLSESYTPSPAITFSRKFHTLSTAIGAPFS